MRLYRIGFTIVALVAAMAVGAWLMRWYVTPTGPVVDESATVLLEQIKKVAKLITVEGYFSEIYDHKDYYYYDISPLRKKALIRVKAKVSMGYDLDKMTIETIPAQKLIRISNIPDPEILSIDHDLDYYDLQEGTFNSFTPQELSQLQAKAKKMIETKAKTSDLGRQAEIQANDMFKAMELLSQNAGWTIEYEGKTTSSTPQ